MHTNHYNNMTSSSSKNATALSQKLRSAIRFWSFGWNRAVIVLSVPIAVLIVAASNIVSSLQLSLQSKSIRGPFSRSRLHSGTILHVVGRLLIISFKLHGLHGILDGLERRVTRLRDKIITDYVAKKPNLAYFWLKKPTLVTLLPDLKLILYQKEGIFNANQAHFGRLLRQKVAINSQIWSPLWCSEFCAFS